MAFEVLWCGTSYALFVCRGEAHAWIPQLPEANARGT
jgi:hypothetical protein